MNLKWFGERRKQDVKQKDYLVSGLVIGNEASKSQNQKIKKSNKWAGWQSNYLITLKSKSTKPATNQYTNQLVCE